MYVTFAAAMKSLFRLFLSLSFLLLNGYQSVSADGSRDHHPFLITASANTSSASLNTLPDQGVRDARFTSSVTEKKHRIFFVEETEDEIAGWTAEKKFCSSPHYFLSFYAPLRSSGHHVFPNRIASVGQQSYTSVQKYIFIQVFRV